MTAARAILDSSVLVRAGVDRRAEEARAWIENVQSRAVVGLAPELVYAEAANALWTLVRSGGLAREDAEGTLADLLDIPLETTSLRELAPEALSLALERDVTAYDACYLVLAEATGAVLVTADRRLAGAAPRAVLVQ